MRLLTHALHKYPVPPILESLLDYRAVISRADVCLIEATQDWLDIGKLQIKPDETTKGLPIEFGQEQYLLLPIEALDSGSGLFSIFVAHHLSF